ncbi:division/outer membrane stress-associated lipid-binding lipoprotein [Alkalimonas delamerensis]|uniref:Division/outer membrane stress-associated lipid-binding lipoprotein n=1 Tax=Alkalimonas delamerensis TaxID=265981 RepID=A0ABT9GQ75_9GAMM|nr:division/outer membrane stress-associated lipid-binding lipoprotein [Alkalimonas delamerensis]MDP4529132.1 division/outer membrane stress-associated lipid-binding lipoprotein [Alkalimonas delamerensis]
MKHYRILALLVTLGLLQGCAAAVLAGGGAAVVSAQDRRTLGSQIDDTGIAMRARQLFSQEDLNKQGRINVTSHNGVVLLTGQVESEQVRQRAGQIARDLQSVRDVHNQLRVGNTISLSTRSRDSWISTRVKTLLLSDSDISGLNIKVTTEDGEVFLMGLVTPAEADKAVEIARHVDGVNRVVRAFEIQ